MSKRDYKTLLQFGDRWIDLGVVTAERLEALGHDFDTSDDKHTEHYRYAVFREYLEAQRPLSPQVAEALYDLGSTDPHPGMGGAMMADIVDLPECPPTVQTKALASGRKHLVRKAEGKKALAESDASGRELP